MVEVRRIPGYIKLNGEPYLVSRDPKSGEFKYAIDNTPKTQVVSRRMDTSTGKSNIVEGLFKGIDGGFSGKLKNSRSMYTFSSDNYHFCTNMFTEREGEWIALPAPHYVFPDAGALPNPLINYTWQAPVVAWEQYNTFLNPHPLDTYFLADHRAFKMQVETSMVVSLDEDFFFEGTAQATGGVVFDNIFYAAMGGGQRTTDRYLRKRDPLTGTWSNDDNNPLSILDVADNGGGLPNFHVVAHGYAINDVVFISGTTTYNGLWTITAVADANHFVTGANVFVANSTGIVNLQDSDVKAEHLVIVGDLMYRSYYDATRGWLVSAVDIVGSNPMLDANWTAGNGILGAGDAFEPVTALIATPLGVLICKSDGVFIYNKTVFGYINVMPELNHNRHPSNGVGANIWQDWIYVPTVIGLKRWRNGVIQDVTPGRGQTQDYETPGIPIAYITGDSNRLYAISKPYQLNVPLNVKAKVATFGVDKTGTGTVTLDPNSVFDGNNETFIDFLGMTKDGFLYLGYENKWHRAHMTIYNKFINQPGGNGSIELQSQFWNGTTWVDENIDFDGTFGWQSTDKDPTTWGKDGDIVIGMIDPTWVKGATSTGSGAPQVLDAGLYWRRWSFSATPPNVSFGLHQVDIGIHSDEALEPMLTGEIETDHGGVVFVMSMTEESGGVLWRTLWAFTKPDILFPDSLNQYGIGGAQAVGYCGVVQPAFLNAKTEGDRYLFVGMENVTYLCPLSNRPDITNVPYTQWAPFPLNPSAILNGSQFDVGPRIHAIVFPDADFGLPQHQKTLTEIEFETYEGFDKSSCEVYYRVDRGAWTFAGFADDQNPDMPMVLTPGGEPTGKEFAIAICFDGESTRPLRLPRIRDIRARVQPRPEMAEMLQLTVELEPETIEPMFTDRRSAHSRYVDLRNLQQTGSSVQLVGLDGATVQAQVLQVSQKSIFNVDKVPKLVADVFLSLPSPRTDDV